MLSPGKLAFLQAEQEKAERQKAYERRRAEAGVWGNPSNPKCPLCGSKMVVREGKYGQFFGCSLYPRCKGTRKIDY